MLKSQRLIQLIMYINTKREFTVRELADEFGLSTRTITRDLQELSELGVPIYSVQGRGGGYRLLQERLLPPIAFTEHEAIALFFACQSLQNFGSTPFDESANAALQKFYHYLPSDTKRQIDRLKDKVTIWNPKRLMITDVLQTLLHAIMTDKPVTIEYDSEGGLSERNIQVVGMYASDGYWYCPAFCHTRQDIRLFRADRIRTARVNDSISYREELERLNRWKSPAATTQEGDITMSVALTARGVRTLASDAWFSTFIDKHEDGGGTCTLHITEDNLRYYADLFWNMGEDAVILQPREAVQYITTKLAAVMDNYSRASS